MATEQEFKLIMQKSQRYATFLPNYETKLKSKESALLARLGFYLLALENITGEKDIDNLCEFIIDTEFCSLVFDINNNDEGLDAVVIEETEHLISLFNFKYRENFSKGKGQKVDDAFNSAKFLHILEIEDTSSLSDRTKTKVNDILLRLNSSSAWNIKLYMVSNDNIPLPPNNATIDTMKKKYGMDIISITLDNIVDYILRRPSDLSANLFLDVNSVMSYTANSLSSAKSFLVQLDMLELIRITSQEKNIRENYKIEDYQLLKEFDYSKSILFDNVRGYLGETKYNKNIIYTLDNFPERFFMFNNGITMTVKGIKTKLQNGDKKISMELTDMQIVNGGQTLRSIYEAKKKDFDQAKLGKAKVLLRIYQIEDDADLANKIAEYTNSQNAISSSDLKSISTYQLTLEAALKDLDILYVRKVGDTGSNDDKDYKYRISMEKTAQILYSKQGFPDRAGSSKKQLFENYYDDIFNDKIGFDEIATCILDYKSIVELYKSENFNKYAKSETKYFYILYLCRSIPDKGTSIQFIEDVLSEYEPNEELSEYRKLLQKGFKDFLDIKMAKRNQVNDSI